MTDLDFLRANKPWLAAGGLLAFSSAYGQTFFISIFADGIRSDFALSHSAWGTIYGLGTLMSAAVMIWLGTLTDRFRVSRIGPLSLFALALACLAMAVNPFVWALPVIVFALRLSGQGMVTHVSRVAIARWFVRSRGKALAISSLGFSIGEAILPVAFVALLAFANWRYLWVLAALLALLAIPVLRSLLRTERSPQALSEETGSLGMGARHWTRRNMLEHWLFWAVFPSLLGPPAFVTAFFFQQVHLARLKDWSHLDLVALFPLYTVASILAMAVAGWAVDKLGSDRMMPFTQLPLALGLVAVGLTGSYLGTAVGICLLAMTVGINNTVPSAFWAEFFGTRHLGAIKALAISVMVLGSAIGPALTGIMIDAGVPLTDQMIWMAVYVLLSSVLVWAGVTSARSALPRPA